MGGIYDFSGIKEVAETLDETDDENIKLMIVGKGDPYKPLLKMKSEKNFNDKMIFTEKIPFEEVPKYIAIADRCILPAYKNETMMNIVLIKICEYMAMGKPVISMSLFGILKEFCDKRNLIYRESLADFGKIKRS